MSEETTEVGTTETPVETTAAETTVPSYVNDDGTWNRDAFGDDLGKHSIFERYFKPEDLVKAKINADKVISGRIEDVFKSDSDEHKALLKEFNGVPALADEYEIRRPEEFATLPEDSQKAINEYFDDSAKWALENGVPKEVFEKFVERDLGRAIEVYNAQVADSESAMQEATDALKAEWKNDFENNVEKTENMAKMLEMPKLAEVLKNNPELMKEFYDGASKITSDDKIIESTQRETMMTIQDQIDDLDDRMLAPEFDTPEMQRSPSYQRLLDKKTALMNKVK